MPPNRTTIPALIADLDRFEAYVALSGRSDFTARFYRRYAEVILTGLYAQKHVDFTRVRPEDLVRAVSGVGRTGFNVVWSAWRAWATWAKAAGHRARVPTPSAKEARKLASANPEAALRMTVDDFHVPREAVTALCRFLFLSSGGLGIPLAVVPALTRGALMRKTLPTLDSRGQLVSGETVRQAVVVVPRGASNGADADVEIFRPRSPAHAAYTERAMQTYVRHAFPGMETPAAATATRNYPLIPDSEDGRRHITYPRLLQLLGLARSINARDTHAGTELHRTQEAAAARDFTAAFADALARESAELREVEARASAGEHARAQAERDAKSATDSDQRRKLRRGIKRLGPEWFDMPRGVPLPDADAPPTTAAQAHAPTQPATAHGEARAPAPAPVVVHPAPSGLGARVLPTLLPRDLPRDELDSDLEDL